MTDSPIKAPFWKRCLRQVRLILIVAAVTLFITRIILPVALNFRHNIGTDLLHNDKDAAARVPLESFILDVNRVAELFDDPEHKIPEMPQAAYWEHKHDLFVVVKFTPYNGLAFGTVAIEQRPGMILYIDIPEQAPSDKPLFIATPATSFYSIYEIVTPKKPKVWWRNFYPLEASL